jgi:hypothetical protein
MYPARPWPGRSLSTLRPGGGLVGARWCGVPRRRSGTRSLFRTSRSRAPGWHGKVTGMVCTPTAHWPSVSDVHSASLKQNLVVRCRQKIPSGQEPSAMTMQLLELGASVPFVPVAPLVVRCRQMVLSRRTLAASNPCHQGMARGCKMSVSHHGSLRHPDANVRGECAVSMRLPGWRS